MTNNEKDLFQGTEVLQRICGTVLGIIGGLFILKVTGITSNLSWIWVLSPATMFGFLIVFLVCAFSNGATIAPETKDEDVNDPS